MMLAADCRDLECELQRRGYRTQQSDMGNIGAGVRSGNVARRDSRVVARVGDVVAREA